MSRLLKPLMLFCVLSFLPGFGSGERLFAPGSDLWERWTRHDVTSSAQIDHRLWDALLSRHVSDNIVGANKVAYGAFSPDDQAQLERYLTTMSAIRISDHNRDEQLAYWMNLYNALTVQVILTHYPVDSIRDIDTSPGLLSSGPWGQELITVEGTPLTLNDIEHRILRPVWKDPRIHYGVNCASIGCPDLRATAFRGQTVHAALDEAANAYVNDPRGVNVRNGKVTVSRIYDWFIEDFGGSERSILDHLLRYARPELAAKLRAVGALDGTQYDWSLNDASG